MTTPRSIRRKQVQAQRKSNVRGLRRQWKLYVTRCKKDGREHDEFLEWLKGKANRPQLTRKVEAKLKGLEQ